MEPSTDKIYDVLKRYWGFTRFRPVQERIIRAAMAGRDTLALMPTGGGKSLTYQVPALAEEGLCIVVTPLIALMKDQVDRLRARHISAVAIHSGLSPRQIDIALDNCVYGDVKFLYVAPERLATEAFRLRVERMHVSLLAVDEAHCISQWGYDFRPSYLRIAELREKLPGVPVLALTASATERVAADIMHHLRFAQPHILRSSFARPNLSYSVRPTDDKNGQLMRLVRNVPGTGIVYVRTREGAGQVADMLRREGVTAAAYHGGLGHAERALRQEEWVAGKVRVMVATNAFGMGIDKPDVRFVVHYSMCDSLESYYQEAGRAGRDGVRSYALLLTAADDGERIVRRFEQEFPPLEKIKDIYEKVCSYLQIGIGDGAGASLIFNIHDFCARERLYSGTVLSALKLLQQNGYMTLTDAQDNPARIMFCVSRDDLYRIRVERNDLDHFIRTLLRLYNGVFTEFRAIDEGELATWSGYTVPRVKELLKRLWQLRVIRYVPSNRSPILFMNEERLPRADLYIAPETYKRRQELMRERFEHMLAYAQNETRCRSAVLETYFGEGDPAPCGVCDICLARKREEKRRKSSAPAPSAPAPTSAASIPSAPSPTSSASGSARKATSVTSVPARQAASTPAARLGENAASADHAPAGFSPSAENGRRTPSVPAAAPHPYAAGPTVSSALPGPAAMTAQSHSAPATETAPSHSAPTVKSAPSDSIPTTETAPSHSVPTAKSAPSHSVPATKTAPSHTGPADPSSASVLPGAKGSSARPDSSALLDTPAPTVISGTAPTPAAAQDTPVSPSATPAAANGASTISSASPTAAHGTPAPSPAAPPTSGSTPALRDRLLRRLAEGPADPRELAEELPGPLQRIGQELRRLLAEGKITTCSDGKLKIIP